MIFFPKYIYLEMNICEDTVNVIVSFLRPIDKYCLSQTCRIYNKYKPNFVQIIKERLQKCLTDNTDINKLINLIKECKSVISGSFILQCLYDENYDTDIDIIVPNDEIKGYNSSINKICRFFFNKGYHNIGQPNDDQLLIRGKDDRPNTLQYGLVPAVSFKYRNGGHVPINIIYTEWTNTFAYIDFYFDFSVCKNIYDFHTLKICDIEGIITKTTKHNLDFTRYRQHIDNANPILVAIDPKECFEKVTEKRIINYKNKGFTIIGH